MRSRPARAAAQSAGSGLVPRNNGGDDLQILADGPFTFTMPVPMGAAYAATVRWASSDMGKATISGGLAATSANRSSPPQVVS